VFDITDVYCSGFPGPLEFINLNAGFVGMMFEKICNAQGYAFVVDFLRSLKSTDG